MMLTVSADVQRTALAALDGRKGTVGVYNYKTGEILCAVSSPTYDPDDVPDVEGNPETYEGVYVNRFLHATYTPGSVFKLVTAAAALDEIPDIGSRTFTCEGSAMPSRSASRAATALTARRRPPEALMSPMRRNPSWHGPASASIRTRSTPVSI